VDMFSKSLDLEYKEHGISVHNQVLYCPLLAARPLPRTGSQTGLCLRGVAAAWFGAGARVRGDKDVKDPEADDGRALARAVGARGRRAHRLRADPVPLLVRAAGPWPDHGQNWRLAHYG
jgi:hypothetical protein